MGVDLDGLELMTIHSADFTEQFQKKLPELKNDEEIMAYLNELSVKYGEEHGGYWNSNSLKHASQYYDSPGEVVHESPSNAPLTVFGYLNATTGDPMRITLYQSETIAEPQLDIAPSAAPAGMENQFSGAPYAAASFVNEYSGFGHFARALHNSMDGKDPWTGQEGNSARLVAQGGLTLGSYAIGGAGAKPVQALGKMAGLNTTLEIAQTKLAPGHKSELTLLKGGFSVATSGSLPAAAVSLGSLILSGHDAVDKERAKADTTKTEDPRP